MSHPSLGLPPRDRTAGFPDDAAALEHNRERLAVRAFEAAVDADPTLLERFDEIGLRRLLRDTGTIMDVLGAALASNDPSVMRSWAEGAVSPYRRRRVSMDDLVTISNAIRAVVDAAITPEALKSADAALDAGIEVFRWHRRIAGDARRRNKLLAFLYKGA